MSIGGILKRKIRRMLMWNAHVMRPDYVHTSIEVDGRSGTYIKPSIVGDMLRISVRLNSQDCILIDRFLGPSVPMRVSYRGVQSTSGLYGVIHVLDVTKSKALFNRLEAVINEFTPYLLRSDRCGWYLVNRFTDVQLRVAPGFSIEVNGYPVD